jgi:hypothetical protein
MDEMQAEQEAQEAHYRSFSSIKSMSHSDHYDDNVAAAFTQRQWLVELTYAQTRHVVAVYRAEARTPQEAVRIADRRAQLATKENYKLRPGNLISHRILPDCDEVREQLGVGGPKTRPKFYSNMRAG